MEADGRDYEAKTVPMATQDVTFARKPFDNSYLGIVDFAISTCEPLDYDNRLPF